MSTEEDKLQEPGKQSEQTPPRRRRRLKIAGMVVLVILVLLQLFLAFGLVGAVRKHVLPQAERNLGVPVTVDRVAASLFGAKFRVSGLNVGNPSNFTESACMSLGDFRVNLGFCRLFAGVIEVSTHVKDLKLTIVRNGAGETNIVEIQRTAAAHAPARATHAASTNAALPELLINDTRVDVLVEYIDHQTTNPPARFGYEMTIKADDVATYTRWATNRWGAFSVGGHLDGKPEVFKADIRGKIAPILDPHRLNFEATGTITNIKTSDLGPLDAPLGIQSDSIAADLRIVCKDGVFQRNSVLTLKIRNLKLVGKRTKRMLGMTIPPSLTVDVQLRGTVDKPDFDLMGTLLRTTGKGLSHGVGSIMDGADGFFKWLSRPATNQSSEVRDRGSERR